MPPKKTNVSATAAEMTPEEVQRLLDSHEALVEALKNFKQEARAPNEGQEEMSMSNVIPRHLPSTYGGGASPQTIYRWKR